MWGIAVGISWGGFVGCRGGLGGSLGFLGVGVGCGYGLVDG